MSGMCAPRLQRELKEQRKVNSDPTLRAKQDIILDVPDTDHIFSWVAMIQGPQETPFAGGTFKVNIKVPSDYPMVPPTASFETKVFHPNVKWNTGEICLDILKDRWSPAWTMMSLCRAIQNLLSDPYADSPLNCDAGNLVRAGDMKGYDEMAKHYAVVYAGAPTPQW